MARTVVAHVLRLENFRCRPAGADVKRTLEKTPSVHASLVRGSGHSTSERRWQDAHGVVWHAHGGRLERVNVQAHHLVETGMRRNDIMNQVNQLIVYVSRTILFRSHLDSYLIRGAMVFTFFAFSIQKWTQYTAEMLVPLISHSPVVFWLLPVFGIRGAGYFLGTTETIFGSLIFLGYWIPRLGVLGALWSIVTFIGRRALFPSYPMDGPTKPVDFRS
jgi:hypothetical protein